MKRHIVQTRNFTKELDSLIKKRQLLLEDFESFTKELTKYPTIGDIITGTGGVRKTRLKSSSGGKSSGFRICYYDLTKKERLYLLAIFAKNEKENLTMEDKKLLKALVKFLKDMHE